MRSGGPGGSVSPATAGAASNAACQREYRTSASAAASRGPVRATATAPARARSTHGGGVTRAPRGPPPGAAPPRRGAAPALAARPPRARSAACPTRAAAARPMRRSVAVSGGRHAAAYACSVAPTAAPIAPGGAAPWRAPATCSSPTAQPASQAGSPNAASSQSITRTPCGAPGGPSSRQLSHFRSPCTRHAGVHSAATPRSAAPTATSASSASATCRAAGPSVPSATGVRSTRSSANGRAPPPTRRPSVSRCHRPIAVPSRSPHHAHSAGSGTAAVASDGPRSSPRSTRTWRASSISSGWGTAAAMLSIHVASRYTSSSPARLRPAARFAALGIFTTTPGRPGGVTRVTTCDRERSSTWRPAVSTGASHPASARTRTPG